ncbi:hypothetical protein D9757_002438 [Collybiopsis confluens]|uniref:FAD-binding PCMH-type domain-containing protein n=1 Tax=Collybiopsis confluens TaxID=2823264 RepID=A0A8H5HY34_9AGAR|nr:hypothetical protein D9757_002438 [Collybiopsis confluens]
MGLGFQHSENLPIMPFSFCGGLRPRKQRGSAAHNAQLLEEFRSECDKNPQLKPLYDIFVNVQDGLPNPKLFFDLWQLVQQDEELLGLYKEKVDNDLNAVGSALAHLFDKGDDVISNAFTKHYEKTGRADAPQDESQLNSVPKKESFMYTDFVDFVATHGKESLDIYEGDGNPMVYLENEVFENWGRTVKNTPSYTFTAKTRAGVQNLIKWASKQNKRVRGQDSGETYQGRSGINFLFLPCCRHTWGDLFSADGDIVVILLPLSTTIDLPSNLKVDKSSDLQGIEVAEEDGQYFAKIAAGTTNDQFREWCFTNKTVALPLNVIMIEITFGGSNAPVCHGAGITTSTLSDLVAEVEYVDPQGNIQTVNDPAELRAAAGCFGLLGIVLSITLRVDKMQKAIMKPQKLPAPLAIPPPPNYPVPKEIDMSKYSSQQLQDAQKAFEDAVENQYYVEWFWFPFQEDVWVNVWKRAEITADEELDAYPSNFQAGLQWLEGFFAEIIVNWSVFQALSGRLQAYLFGTIGMLQMPSVPDDKHTIQTYVSEALHFRRGIQNMRCLDSEWEIPIPAVKGGKTRDYSVIQRAWWDGITAFYKNVDTCPMRVTLEMRLTGSSNILLAPQQHNDFGTCSIEVLTTLNPTRDEWRDFKQQVVNLWASYTDADGKPLNIRPHWAKEWQGLQVRGKDVIEYLREDAYAEEIKDFVGTLSSITSKRGSSLDETRERFSNPLLEKLIFGVE